jgi:hypothetical protein
MKRKMGILSTVFVLFSLVTAGASRAADHDHHGHARHGMILLGTQEVFASHIVYKEPHHFQVLAKLNLDDATLQKYLTAKAQRPNDLFILVLDPIDLRDIGSLGRLTGKILRQDETGTKHDLVLGVEIPKGKLQVLYFDELPLSLKAE